MRPRLLFLSQCLPFPPHSGVANRTFHILCELQREFEVHLLAYSRRSHQPTADARLDAQRALQGHVARVFPPTPMAFEYSGLTRIWCHIKSVGTGRPYTYYEYSAPALQPQLQRALADGMPDLIHVDSLDLYGVLPALPRVPVAVTHHSVESDLLRSRARYFRPLWLRPYLRHQADLLEGVERRHCPEVGLNVMMSQVDADRLRQLAPTARTVTIPNGVDLEFFKPVHPAVPSRRVVFLGPTYMYPNRDAVEFFLAHVWSGVQREIPEASFEIIGKAPEDFRRRFAGQDGVTWHGYVPDVRPILAGAACSVVPIRIGGGTRLKILDSWAMGKAVVSTAVGCEGLDTIEGQNILLRDEPDAFAKAIVEVLRDEQLRHRLGSAGRATVERSYGWNAIGDRLITAYRDMLGGGVRRGAPSTVAHSRNAG